MKSSLPWQDILDAKQVNARDLANYHRDVAQALCELSCIEGSDLKAAHAEIENDHRKHMMSIVQSRADTMMTRKRMDQISTYLVEILTNNSALWQEVLHYQHNRCFEGQPPSRDMLSSSWVDAVQRDFLKAAGFDPLSKAGSEIGPSLFSVRSLPKYAELGILTEELVWQRIKDSTNPAPLASRVPDDPAFLGVYVEGVKLVYKLVKRFLCDRDTQQDALGRETFNHSFMSAGEIAFRVLHSLDIIRDADGTPPQGRYCSGPSTAVFVQPVEAVEGQINQRTEIAPSLGHVLCAVSYMSNQYGCGFNLKNTPAKTDDLAQNFISASQAAGLCVKLGEEHAFWLPFCDDEILSLYRNVDVGQYADDLYTPPQQTAQLIQTNMANELAGLPKEIDFQTLRMKVIKPWELRQKQIGWVYRPDSKIAQSFWIAVADAMGITVLPHKPPFPKI